MNFMFLMWKRKLINMRKLTNGIYKTIKLVILITIIYISVCFYMGAKNGVSSLYDFFSKPYNGVKELLNRPISDKSTEIKEREEICVREDEEISTGDTRASTEKKSRGNNHKTETNTSITPPVQIVNNHITSNSSSHTLFIVATGIVIVIIYVTAEETTKTFFNSVARGTSIGLAISIAIDAIKCAWYDEYKNKGGETTFKEKMTYREKMSKRIRSYDKTIIQNIAGPLASTCFEKTKFYSDLPALFGLLMSPIASIIAGSVAGFVYESAKGYLGSSSYLWAKEKVTQAD